MISLIFQSTVLGRDHSCHDSSTLLVMRGQNYLDQSLLRLEIPILIPKLLHLHVNKPIESI